MRQEQQEQKNWSMPGLLLRVEGVAVFAAALGMTMHQGYSLGWFFALLLWPDVAILFYGINTKVGSVAYNILHNYLLPLGLLCFAVVTTAPLWMQFSLIWLGHIGMDRAFGYGLKYPTHFKATHLNHV